VYALQGLQQGPSGEHYGAVCFILRLQAPWAVNMTVNLATGDIIDMGYSSSSSSSSSGKSRTVDMHGAFLMPVNVLLGFPIVFLADLPYIASKHSCNLMPSYLEPSHAGGGVANLGVLITILLRCSTTAFMPLRTTAAPLCHCTAVLLPHNPSAPQGFVDPHVHLVPGGLLLSSINLRNLQGGRQEFAQRVAAAAAAGGSNGSNGGSSGSSGGSSGSDRSAWLIGIGWSESDWGGDLPHRSWIDEVGRAVLVVQGNCLGGKGGRQLGRTGCLYCTSFLTSHKIKS
jgi:hypothetical protein